MSYRDPLSNIDTSASMNRPGGDQGQQAKDAAKEKGQEVASKAQEKGQEVASQAQSDPTQLRQGR